MKLHRATFRIRTILVLAFLAATAVAAASGSIWYAFYHVPTSSDARRVDARLPRA
jgi:multidrug resistance efflux pump